MANIVEVDFDHKMVCPFRNKVTVTQEVNESGIPQQNQITTYPECQYAMCPFYNPEGKTTRDKCDQAAILLQKLM